MNITNRSNESLISLSRWGKITGFLSIINFCAFLTYIFYTGLVKEKIALISLGENFPVPFFNIWTPLFLILFYVIPAILLVISSIKLYNVSYHDKIDDFSEGLKMMRIHLQYTFIANCVVLLMAWFGIPLTMFFLKNISSLMQ